MINRARCREIHQALDAVMEKFAKEHGMAFTPGHCPLQQHRNQFQHQDLGSER